MLFFLPGVFLVVVLAQETKSFVPTPCGGWFPPQDIPGEQFYGPPDTTVDTWQLWFTNITQWRQRTREQYNISDTLLSSPDLRWVRDASANASVRFVLLQHTKKYTIEKYVNDTLARYGGVDAILVWPTYPNIGMDDRNQFDWVQSLPYGGVSHLREAVHELDQRFGIKVMLPYNPWDTGTRRLNNNRSDAEELARFLNLSDTVGIFGDTMYGMGQDIYTTAFNVLNRSIALQPENLV
eukprot:PhF_6_TR935/c0_g1_i3/m.1669